MILAETKSNNRTILIIAGIMIAVAAPVLAYFVWYVSPHDVTEDVRLIAIVPSGCVVETMDGHAITVGPCTGEPGDIITVTYDKKIKERALAMNPPN